MRLMGGRVLVVMLAVRVLVGVAMVAVWLLRGEVVGCDSVLV